MPDQQHIGDVYAARAMGEPASTISIPTIREARDMVYSGSPEPVRPPTAAPESAPRNRKSVRRKVSPFTVVLILLAVSVVSVLYIGNILAVGRLLARINRLETMHRQIRNDQEILRVQINRLSSLERIEQAAGSDLGLKKSDQIPVWIPVDPARVNRIEETLEQQAEQRR